jgi:LytS/YehU family sensor histidine kinase
MFAGCLGGPIGGIIAGSIAGIFRLLWGLPDVTVGTSIPCAILLY